MSWTTGIAIYGAVLATISAVIGVTSFLRTLPKPVEWRIVTVGRHSYALQNVGRRKASNVRIRDEGTGVLITTHGDEPFDVPAGESWRFTIAWPSPMVEGGWQLTLTWDGQPIPKPVLLPDQALVATSAPPSKFPFESR